MKKNILLLGLVMASLGLGLSVTTVTANAKVYSTLPKALRGNWKKHIKWIRSYNGKRTEAAYTYQGFKHTFWTGEAQADTYRETVRYVVSKGHGVYKVHTKTDIGGVKYHVDTFKRTKHTLKITGNGGWYAPIYNSRHKVIQ